jgi:uncharacterized protein with ATP-grasp and redox domains
MKIQPECLTCISAQVKAVTDVLELTDQQRMEVLEESAGILAAVDFTTFSPETIASIWSNIVKTTGEVDPYAKIKSLCNREAMRLIPDAKAHIGRADDPLALAMRYAIAGNLIDYGLEKPVPLEEQNEKIDWIVRTDFSIDDLDELRGALKQANTLLYLGDNAGEIVFDRLFIENILTQNPHLRVTYAVKGKPVINDATMRDAREAGMDQVARVIDNGDGSPGTVLRCTSEAFRCEYKDAGVVISKGQGNYECLSGSEKENLFFLFTAKCDAICANAHVPKLSMVCMKNRKP